MQASNMLDYKIVNIGSLWNIGTTKIKIDNTNRRKKFNAEVIRKKEGVFLVFASGKVIATGFKCVSVAGAVLQQHFPDKSVIFMRVVNITAHTFIPFTVNTRLMLEMYKDTTYEPEIYPAVYIKINGVTLVYYSTGSIIITGAKTEADISNALAQFRSRADIVRI